MRHQNSNINVGSVCCLKLRTKCRVQRTIKITDFIGACYHNPDIRANKTVRM